MQSCNIIETTKQWKSFLNFKTNLFPFLFLYDIYPEIMYILLSFIFRLANLLAGKNSSYNNLDNLAPYVLFILCLKWDWVEKIELGIGKWISIHRSFLSFIQMCCVGWQNCDSWNQRWSASNVGPCSSKISEKNSLSSRYQATL